MKGLRYMLTIMLSLLVICSGVGVSVCDCSTCKIACFLCSTPCSSCERDEDCDYDKDSDATCEEEGCTVNVYKIDQTKHNTESLVSVLSFELFCELLPDFRSVLSIGEAHTPYVVPPCSAGSRHFLALYSTLLI